MVDETTDVSNFSEANINVEGSPGHEPKLEPNDLIHHTEEARIFEFFSRYEGHLALDSSSTHYRSLYAASRGTYKASPSFRPSPPRPSSIPFRSSR